MQDFALFADIIGTYILEGCVLYSLFGFLIILRAVRQYAPNPARRDLTMVIMVVMLSYALHATKIVWDSFNPDHFPIWVTRAVLLIILPITGISTFRLYDNRNSWLKYLRLR